MLLFSGSMHKFWTCDTDDVSKKGVYVIRQRVFQPPDHGFRENSIYLTRSPSNRVPGLTIPLPFA